MTDYVAGPDDAGERLDAFVARAAGITRARAARLIGEGAVSVDGGATTKSARVAGGTRVSVDLPPEPAPPAPEAIDVPVVYEDDHLLVVAKPAGLVVHPAPGHPSGTLVNALLARSKRPAGGAAERPGIVHRLDAGTSGLLLIALDEATHEALVADLAARRVARTYLAMVEGVPDTETGTVDAPIGRSPAHRKKMAVVAGGKPAVTEWSMLERFAGCALLEVKPRTGRTHQIRVHLAAAGHPVAGDAGYGHDRQLARALGLERPFLHAWRLALNHPATGARLELEDELPADLVGALARARDRSRAG